MLSAKCCCLLSAGRLCATVCCVPLVRAIFMFCVLCAARCVLCAVSECCALLCAALCAVVCAALCSTRKLYSNPLEENRHDLI